MRKQCWLIASLFAVACAGGTAPPRSTPASAGSRAAERERVGPPSEYAAARASTDGERQARLERRFARSPALAVLNGRASYYGDALAGHATASGEPYDPRAFTAAARHLPFGTVLRVVRMPHGPAVYVRVNDRGPFGSRGRILDVSHAAAEKLGMLRAGVVRVRAEVVHYGRRRRRAARHHH